MTNSSDPLGTLYRSATGPPFPRRMVISPVRHRAIFCPWSLVTTT